MHNKRKILAVTGARSEYDLMYSIYKELNAELTIDFSLIITGPHLSEKYGLTAGFVEADGFRISDKIFSLIDSDEKLARVSSIGNQIPLLAQTLYREKPDIVLVAGDREEAISVTLTCAYMSIPVAHFFGGDIAKDGNIDNSVRYAASKFAHIHFPSLEAHKMNLLRLGEEDWRIFAVGNPALDRLQDIPEIEKGELFNRLTLFNQSIDQYCVLIQHSIITEVEKQSSHIRLTLDSILESDIFCFLNYPNSDAGSADIINAFADYSAKYPNKFYTFKNLDRNTYINLLRNSEFLIGNSSSGLLEAPSMALPAINIGSRQRGRFHGDNVIFVDNNKEQIKNAIYTALHDHEFRNKLLSKYNPYGDGKTAEKVLKVLKEIPINDKLKFKDITY